MVFLPNIYIDADFDFPAHAYLKDLVRSDTMNFSFEEQTTFYLDQDSTTYVEPINKDAANLGKVLPTRIKHSTSIDINPLTRKLLLCSPVSS